MIADKEYTLLLEKCRELPAAEGKCLVNDYLENLLLTVLDYQIKPTVLKKAINYYRTQRRDEIREYADLEHLLLKHPDDEEGNTLVAHYLWNNASWNRAALLRKLADYFADAGITSQDRLKAWAQNTRFENFQGRVPGMGYVLYQRLIMRLGIETIKPDTHVIDFVNSILDRSETDLPDIAAKLTKAAAQMGIPPYELDWRIWEHQMGLISTGQMAVKA